MKENLVHDSLAESDEFFAYTDYFFRQLAVLLQAMDQSIQIPASDQAPDVTELQTLLHEITDGPMDLIAATCRQKLAEIKQPGIEPESSKTSDEFAPWFSAHDQLKTLLTTTMETTQRLKSHTRFAETSMDRMDTRMAELAKTHKEAEKKRMEALQQTEKQVAKAARGEIYLNAWHAHQLWTASCRLYPPLPAKLRYLLPCSLIFLPKDSFSHQLFLTLQSCSPLWSDRFQAQNNS